MSSRPDMLNSRKGKSSAASVIVLILLIVVACVVLVDSLRSMFTFAVEIKGSSMLNTLYGGELVGSDYRGGDIVYALRNFQAERGDVVIIDTTKNGASGSGNIFSSDVIIKRLIAVEGDSVKCENGIVYLKTAGGSYEAIEEEYAITNELYHFSEVTLGEGEIFFLGDNRPVSLDSQEVAEAGYSAFRYESIIGIVPDWAISMKNFSTGWERFRAAFRSLFK